MMRCRSIALIGLAMLAGCGRFGFATTLLLDADAIGNDLDAGGDAIDSGDVRTPDGSKPDAADVDTGEVTTGDAQILNGDAGDAKTQLRCTLDLTGALVAYWNLDESSGPRNDFAGNDLQEAGTVFDEGGVIDGAAGFASDSGHLEASDSPAISMGATDFTIAAWVRLDQKTGQPEQGIIAKGTSGAFPTNEFQVFYFASTDRFRFTVGDGTVASGVDADALGAPNLGDWYLVVAWFDQAGGVLRIQVNNGIVDQAASTPNGHDSHDSDGSIYVGRLFGTTRNWVGAVDELAIWKRQLSVYERADLFCSGMGRPVL